MKKATISMMAAGLAMLLLLLAACGNNEPPAASSGSPSASPSAQGSTSAEPEPEPVTIRIGVADSPGEKENAEAVARVFREQYPHITVHIEPLIGDYKQKLMAQAASGDLPDVVWAFDGLVKEFVDAGIFEPLDEHLQRNGVDVADIYPGMLGLGQVDGKTYLLPRDYNHVVTYVNKTLLDQEGLPMPDNGWTWEQFLEYADKLTKRDGSGNVTQWAVSAHPEWSAVWNPFALGWGGTYADTANKKLTFSDPKVVQGLTALWDLVKQGYALDPTGQYPEDMFMAGKVAFHFHVKPSAMQLNDAAKAKGFEWDVVTFPKLPGRHAVGGGTSGYGVYAKSDHKEEAAAFVSMFVKPEGQLAFGSTGNAVPVLKSLASDPQWRDYPVPGKNADAFVLYPEADVLPILETQLPVAVAAEAGKLLGEARERYLLNGDSVEESLKTLDERANALWK